MTPAVLTILCSVGATLMAGAAIARAAVALRVPLLSEPTVVGSLLERLSVSAAAPSVTVVMDLDEGEESRRGLVRLLAQRYRNLEVIAVVAGRRLRTDLNLAFALEEIGVAPGALIHRSARDERLLVVTSDRNDADGRRALGASVAGGELIMLVDHRWALRETAVSDLVTRWMATGRPTAVLGFLGPTGSRWARRLSHVTTRAEVTAVRGLTNRGQRSVGSVGVQTVLPGLKATIVGLIRRDAYDATGGLHGVVGTGDDWDDLLAELGRWGRDVGRPFQVSVVSKPIGSVAFADRTPPVPNRLQSNPSTRIRRRLNGAYRTLTMAGFVAGVAGLATGWVPSQVLWLVAAGPLLMVSAVIVGLIVDDRTGESVGSTAGRVDLLAASVPVALTAVVGSPVPLGRR